MHRDHSVLYLDRVAAVQAPIYVIRHPLSLWHRPMIGKTRRLVPGLCVQIQDGQCDRGECQLQ